MLFIIFPLSDILCPVCMGVSTLTICLIVKPVALVDVAISVVQLAVAVRFAELPLALIERTIRPSLLAHPVS
jgi:hypothetical protein